MGILAAGYGWLACRKQQLKEQFYYNHRLFEPQAQMLIFRRLQGLPGVCQGTASSDDVVIAVAGSSASGPHRGPEPYCLCACAFKISITRTSASRTFINRLHLPSSIRNSDLRPQLFIVCGLLGSAPIHYPQPFNRYLP